MLLGTGKGFPDSLSQFISGLEDPGQATHLFGFLVAPLMLVAFRTRHLFNSFRKSHLNSVVWPQELKAGNWLFPHSTPSGQWANTEPTLLRHTPILSPHIEWFHPVKAAKGNLFAPPHAQQEPLGQAWVGLA